jgi:site-specific DNA recombinase
MIAARAHTPAQHKAHRAKRPYALRGCVWCGLCGRRMQSHWVNDAPYYRCRFAAEYALANRIEHPLNVYMSESAVIGAVDGWLAREFAPHRMGETIRALADAQPADEPRSGGQGQAESKIAECDQKLAQYRAALDAGASPATVAAWIAETEAEKARHEIGLRQVAKPRERMTEREIRTIIDKLADVARVLADADADDKSEIFRRLGLKLTYHPGRRLVKAEIAPDQHGFFESVRGPTRTLRT